MAGADVQRLAGGQRRAQKFLGVGDRLVSDPRPGRAARRSPRTGAAGAMGVAGVDARRGKFNEIRAVVKQVVGAPSGRWPPLISTARAPSSWSFSAMARMSTGFSAIRPPANSALSIRFGVSSRMSGNNCATIGATSSSPPRLCPPVATRTGSSTTILRRVSGQLRGDGRDIFRRADHADLHRIDADVGKDRRRSAPRQNRPEPAGPPARRACSAPSARSPTAMP